MAPLVCVRYARAPNNALARSYEDGEGRKPWTKGRVCVHKQVRTRMRKPTAHFEPISPRDKGDGGDGGGSGATARFGRCRALLLFGCAAIAVTAAVSSGAVQRIFGLRSTAPGCSKLRPTHDED